jgi:Flp pilus assembly pilin Flp
MLGVRGGERGRGPVVRRSLECYLVDTASSATIEYAFIAAGVALAIALGLGHLGAEGRFAARSLFRFKP